jgi:group II intron reverse transcriptase/maturase
MAEDKSTGLLKVMERAKDPKFVFLSLAHLIDEAALKRAFHRIRKDAAVGFDGIAKEQYEQDLDRNVHDLHERLRTLRWRHRPIRRVHIPKANGKMRPIGISTVEDKIVQDALREILEAVYEPIFRGCSFGFRRGRSAHDALRSLNSVLYKGRVNWILEIDIETFFDSIDRKMLMEMLRERVVDGSLKRLVGKCLHVGILDGEEYSEPDRGTVQGSALSPLLGNVYLHHVLDLWFEHDVRPRLGGEAHLVRYADDAVLCFEREEDARRVMEVLTKRFERYGLKLHREKTRLLPFTRPNKTDKCSKGPATFDFLGFTHYWGKARGGFWMPQVKTQKARLRRFLVAVADWCHRYRHKPVKEQHVALTRRIAGHFNYFGVNGNMRCLRQVRRVCEEVWFKWLNRRSQRARKSWARYTDLLRDYPLSQARIRAQLWHASS